MGGLVVLAGAPLDLLVLGQAALELGVGFLDHRLRRSLRGVVGRHLLDRNRLGLGPAPAAAGADDPAGPGLAGGLTHGHGRFLGDLVFAAGPVGQDVALVDPDLHADAPEGCAGLGQAVVDVGPERVERDPTLPVPLPTGHFSTAEAARALDPDPLGAGLHGRLHRSLHGPAERHPAGQLVGHALGDEVGVELGLLDLLDVQLDLRIARDLVQPLAEAVGLDAATADDDAGAGGVGVGPPAGPGGLDLDAADRCPAELGVEILADPDVLGEVVGVLAIPEPA